MIVVEGIGLTQEEGKPIQELRVGDALYCPPNIKHWHGASPNSYMKHMQSQTTVSEMTRFDRGLEIQTNTFGQGILDAYINAPENQKHIREYLSSMCFGDCYTREGLDMKTRELLTFIMIISLGGQESQATGHAMGNLSVGNSKDTLIEAVTQCIPYIGYPRTLNAIYKTWQGDKNE